MLPLNVMTQLTWGVKKKRQKKLRAELQIIEDIGGKIPKSEEIGGLFVIGGSG